MTMGKHDSGMLGFGFTSQRLGFPVVGLSRLKSTLTIKGERVKPQGKDWRGCPGSGSIGQAQPGTPHSRSGATEPITDLIHWREWGSWCFSKLEGIAGTV